MKLIIDSKRLRWLSIFLPVMSKIINFKQSGPIVMILKWKFQENVENFHLLETITTCRKLIFYMLYFVIFQLHKVEWYHFQFFFLGYYYYFSNFRINVKYSPDRFQFIIFKWVHFVKQQKLLKLTLRCHLIIKVQLFCWGEALGKAIILF